MGNFSSERVLLFCFVMLQHDRMVRKGPDIHRLLDRDVLVSGVMDTLIFSYKRPIAAMGVKAFPLMLLGSFLK